MVKPGTRELICSLPWQTNSIFVMYIQPPEKPYSAPIYRGLSVTPTILIYYTPARRIFPLQKIGTLLRQSALRVLGLISLALLLCINSVLMFWQGHVLGYNEPLSCSGDSLFEYALVLNLGFKKTRSECTVPCTW